MAQLSLDRIVKEYGGKRVVDDVSLTIDDGELFVLVGPSGCGKTTTLRIVAGLEHADAGSVSIGARDVTGAPPGARDVAMVFQSFALFPHMNVFENLAFGMSVRGSTRDEIVTSVTEAAGRLGLGGLLDRKPRELSGGERQRVALGRTLVRAPSVVLMDEPLSNLDAPLRAQMRGEIAGLQETLRTTTVYVTHDQTEALAMGHRLGVMRDGMLEQTGEPRDVYDRPGTVFVARFIGSPAMNLIAAAGDHGGVRWSAGHVKAESTQRDVILGVRPEHVHVRGSRWSGQAWGAPVFSARIERLEPLGDQMIVTLDAAGVTLLARVEPSFACARGDAVEAWLDPARIHLFDPASGRRL